MWARIEIAVLFIMWTATVVVGLYIAATGLIWSGDGRSLNYLIAGAIFATTGGYGLYKDFIAAALVRDDVTDSTGRS
jgi:hypothetical protein